MTDNLLHEPLFACAAEGAERVAVVSADRTLTFGELAAEADEVAGSLCARGIGRGDLVGVLAPGSWQQVVAVFGVLRAGAAYLPLDVGWPLGRLEQLVELSGTRLVVGSQAGPAAGEKVLGGVPVLSLKSATEAAIASPGDLPAVTSEDLAYVIYTSGSTGMPKGVAIDHGAAMNTIRDINRRFNIGPFDRVLATSSLTFDLSVYDIFGVLGVGGGLVLPGAGAAKDPSSWAQTVRQHRVTVWNSVPALMQMLVDYVDGDTERIGDTLRLVLLSGDWIPVWLPDRIRTLLPQARVISLGGATEAAIWSIFHEIDRVERDWESIPYGQALTGQAMYVLDEQLEECPAGVPGQLFIAGKGLARCYWRDDARTRESFLFHPRTGDRLYRTGDRGVRHDDGVIQFLGRLDLQVKVHGFRVELGEIEAVLNRHPHVREAVVVAVDTAGDGRQLVAHVVGDAHAPREADLRELVAQHLPHYMVPARVEAHDALPLTGNGKVDRARLARYPSVELDQSTVRVSGAGTGPLAAVVAEVLNRSDVDMRRSFLAMGGHSLLAVRTVARLRERIGVEMPVEPLLDGRPLDAVAAELEHATHLVASHEPPLLPRPEPRPVEMLSHQQEEVWFLDQLVGGNRAYHFQCTVHLSGELRVDLLERALNVVIARHQILRTTFVSTPDGVRQHVAARYRCHLPVVDISGLPDEEKSHALAQIVAKEVGRRFDLSRLPLIRWKLLRLAPTEHVLVQLEHHLVHDGWSLAVLWSEIEACYTAWVRGERPPLLELPLQYADYARWQRELDGSPASRRSLDYWSRHLDDLPAPVDLPFARPRPPQQTFAGEATRVELDQTSYRRLRQFSRDEGASVFATMFAAFAALLHRYTKATDLPIGSAVANRIPGTEHLIGMLVNTVVLRLRTEPDLTFRDLLRHTREVVLAAMSHQDAPFAEVVREVRPPRDASRNPIVQICFSFHDSPVPELAWPGVSGRIVERSNQTAKFDLNVIVVPRAEQRAGARTAQRTDKLAMIWEYSTDLLDHEMVTDMIGHYRTLLDAAVDHPDIPLALLPLLDPAQQAALVAWNDTARAQRAEDDVVALVREAARRSPAAQAIVTSAGTLTYRRLDQWSDALAAALREVIPGTPAGGGHPDLGLVVPLLLDRSPEIFVAMLAALKLGLPYSVLDPRDPPARTRLNLRDMGAGVVVTRRAVRAELSPALREGLPHLVLADEAAHPEPPVPPDGVGDSSLAYLLYTSGTTGTPKGVMVTRAAVNNYCTWQRRTLEITSEDRSSQLAALTFDGSAVEFWPYLTAGASVHLVDEELRTDPPGLLRWVQARGITRMFAPTPLLEMLLNEPAIVEVPLVTVMTGGEVLRRRSPAGARFRLYNMYGPTETTIASTFAVVAPGPAGEPAPVGYPIDNTMVHVLDERGQPIPPNIIGEVYIGGVGVACGYRGRPALTAESFLPDPHRPGAHRYRTGDLGHRQRDGSLVVLGRRDTQVKVRGSRVELGEVETALRGVTGVAQAAARLWHERELGRQALAAYLVLAAGAEVDPAQVRTSLAVRLPSYMVPTDLMVIAELPLTIHGKVDRAALPAPHPPASARPEVPTSAADPDGELSYQQRLLCRLWAEMLGVTRVKVDDDFYALGGHSLLAMRMAARLREEHGITLPVSAILESPTVGELAQRIPNHGSPGTDVGRMVRSLTVGVVAG